MKVVIKRIESVNRKGVKKETGKAWQVDVTNIITDVAFDDTISEADNQTIAFGAKDLVYQVGEKPSSQNYFKYGLDKLRGLLPLECEVELGQGFDSYGNPTPCIVGITPIKPQSKAVTQ